MREELTTEQIIKLAFDKVFAADSIKIDTKDRVLTITADHGNGNSVEIKIVTLPLIPLLKDVFNDKITVECYVNSIRAYSINTLIAVVRQYIQRLPSLLIKQQNDEARQRAFDFITKQ